MTIRTVIGSGRPGSDGFRLFIPVLVIAALAFAAATPFTLGLWDEIYYTSWIDDPAAYDALVHPFGLALHLVYAALGRSLIALRLLGIGLLLATGAALGSAIARYYRVTAPDAPLAHLPLVGAVAGLLYFVLWVLTPSYNLLANAGAALVAAGAFGWAAADRGAGGRDWPASLWCGLGGALAFLGKPTFAILAAVFIAVQLLSIIRRGWTVVMRRAAIAGVAAALPVLLSIIGVMPFNTFRARVDAGVAVLSADYSVISLIRQTIGSVMNGPWYFFVTAAVLSLSLATAPRPLGGERGRRALVALAMATVGLDAIMLARLAVRGLVGGINPWSAFVGTPVIALMLATLALGVMLRPALARSPAQLVPMLLLVMIPYLISFGTANDMLQQAGMSLFPIMLAGVLCARLCFGPWLVRWAELGWVAVAGLLLVWSAIRPYNQPATVFASTQVVTLPFSASRLRVDADTAAYLHHLGRLRTEAGITADTPVLDLSGVAPGTVALLGARAPFFPWMIHFSKDPGALAAAAWRSMTPEDRRRTWIVGPVHPRFAEHPAIAQLAASGRYRRVAVLRYSPGAVSWPVAPGPQRPLVMFWAPAPR